MDARPPTVTPDRNGRRAVTAVFAVNGLLLSTWFVRIPVIQSSLDMSDGTLGLVIAAMSIGVILALPLAGAAIARFGSRNVILAGICVAIVAAPLIPVANSAVMLTVVLTALGISNSSVDMGMNAQGIAVETTYRRSILVGFHAWWSVGSLIGAGIGALTLSFGVSSQLHFTAVTVVVLAVTLGAMPWLRTDDRAASTGDELHAQPRKVLALPRGALLPIAIVGFGGALGEGLGNDWSGIFMRDAVQVPEEQYGYAFVALTIAMTLVRLVGDRITDRLGPSRTVTTGAWLAAGGLALAAALPTIPTTLLGFFLVGAGVGASIPLAFAAGGRLTASPGEGVAAVATLTYMAFLVGPPVVGWLNDLTDIRWSMLLGAVVVALAAGRPGVLPADAHDHDAAHADTDHGPAEPSSS